MFVAYVMCTEAVWGKYTQTHTHINARSRTRIHDAHTYMRAHATHTYTHTHTRAHNTIRIQVLVEISRILHHLSFDGTPMSMRLLVQTAHSAAVVSFALSALKPRRRHGSLECLARVDRTNQYRTSRWAYKMASGDLFILFLPREKERAREWEREYFFCSYTRSFSCDYALFPK